MALKDWVKVKTNKWHGTVSFSNYDTNDNVTLRYDGDFYKSWEAVYGKVGKPKFKKFKTKAQALKFAKAYMRKN